jgi:D-arginine dehydrogenase
MATWMAKFDFLVIGGGIAGASVAATLAGEAKVMLLEAEEQPGYHSTGRSAALFSEIYGNATIRALSRASRAFLFDPPADFTNQPLVRPRGTLFMASAAQMERLAAFAALPDVTPATQLLTPAEMKLLCPLLRDDYIAGGLHEPRSMDLEVHELHHGYIRQCRRRGGVLSMNARVTSIARRKGEWHVTAGGEELSAAVLINAAGAWADEIAVMAGVPPVGLQAHRRTAVLVAAPADTVIDRWPLLIDIDEQFYVKPDAGFLLLSPADETPTEPCDAQPEQIDIAIAVHRAEEAMTLDVRSIKHSWAGLRNFVSDRTPVVGYEPSADGFFWLAGQGGYGIQTAPAVARAAAALALGRSLPEDLTTWGVTADAIAPGRLRTLEQASGAISARAHAG